MESDYIMFFVFFKCLLAEVDKVAVQSNKRQQSKAMRVNSMFLGKSGNWGEYGLLFLRGNGE